MKLNIENCAKNGEPGHKEWALEELVRNLKEMRNRSNAGDMHAAVTEFFEVFRFNDGVGVAALAAQPGSVGEPVAWQMLVGVNWVPCSEGAAIVHRNNGTAAVRALGVLAAAPTGAKPAQTDAVDAEAVALSPEQEEWVMDLAQKHNLGRRVGQIGTLQGVSPDVFYTDASYRTRELFDFAAELLAADELSTKERRGLVVNWFAEDWAIHQALGLLDDYDTERAAIRATKGGKL